MRITAFGFGFALVAMLLLLVVDSEAAGYVTNCNPEIIPIGGDFYTTVDRLLMNLVANTAMNGYSYKTSFPGTTTAYGEATCSTTSATDCTFCLGLASDAIFLYCNYAVGASINYLDECYLRYEQFSF